MSDELKARVEALEKLVSTYAEIDKGKDRREILDDAKVMAIYSIAHDLATNAGVSPDAFLAHYKAKFRFWHDYYLREAENVSQAYAAQLDQREPEHMPDGDSLPSIFDPLPPEES
jgi:hypothetical protein